MKIRIPFRYAGGTVQSGLIALLGILFNQKRNILKIKCRLCGKVRLRQLGNTPFCGIATAVSMVIKTACPFPVPGKTCAVCDPRGINIYPKHCCVPLEAMLCPLPNLGS